MINALQRELQEVKSKRDDLQIWLCEHTKHPDFLKIANDRNHLSIKIDGIKFKIGQLEKGLPINGEPDLLMTVIELERIDHQTINQ